MSPVSLVFHTKVTVNIGLKKVFRMVTSIPWIRWRNDTNNTICHKPVQKRPIKWSTFRHPTHTNHRWHDQNDTFPIILRATWPQGPHLQDPLYLSGRCADSGVSGGPAHLFSSRLTQQFIFSHFWNGIHANCSIIRWLFQQFIVIRNKCIRRAAPKSWSECTTCIWRAAHKSWSI